MITKPVRLSKVLFDEAGRSGRLYHRSAAGQLEYWAELGRSVECFLGPVDLLKVASGMAELVVQARASQPVLSTQVLNDLYQAQQQGSLAEMVAEGGGPRYQASAQHQGYLEQLSEDGQRRLGRFVDGEFVEGL